MLANTSINVSMEEGSIFLPLLKLGEVDEGKYLSLVITTLTFGSSHSFIHC